jgi:hypothetical protein
MKKAVIVSKVAQMKTELRFGWWALIKIDMLWDQETHLLAVPFDPAPEAVVVAILMMGARSPVIRLKLLARASPVPR